MTDPTDCFHCSRRTRVVVKGRYYGFLLSHVSYRLNTMSLRVDNLYWPFTNCSAREGTFSWFDDPFSSILDLSHFVAFSVSRQGFGSFSFEWGFWNLSWQVQLSRACKGRRAVPREDFPQFLFLLEWSLFWLSFTSHQLYRQSLNWSQIRWRLSLYGIESLLGDDFRN